MGGWFGRPSGDDGGASPLLPSTVADTYKSTPAWVMTTKSSIKLLLLVSEISDDKINIEI